MGSKGGSPPPPPDYVGFAEAQAGASREITEQQTWANRPDQYIPWGSVEWDTTQVWDPTTEQYVNRWQQTTNLAPESQWALDNQMYLQGARSELGGTLMDRAAGEFAGEMDWSQFNDWGPMADVYQMDPLQLSGEINTAGMQDINIGAGTQLPQAGDYSGMVQDVRYGPQQASDVMFGPQAGNVQYGPQAYGVDSDVAQRAAQSSIGQTPEEIRQNAENALYGKATSRLDPQWNEQQAQLREQLLSQGLREGDAAYDRAMDNFNRAKTDAYGQAQYQSVIGGGEEAQRHYDQLMGQAGLYNQAMQQDFGQDLGASQFYNQAMQQRFDQGGMYADRYNQAQQQQFDQGGAYADRYNQALAQGFSQEQASAQAYNAATQQKFDQMFGSQGQQFMEGLQQAQANLGMQQQQYQQQMGLREQQFMEAAKQRGMTNEAAMQAWQSERAQYDQMFSQQMQQANYQNELRINQIQEEMQRRGFTLNEINALISGQQVANPTFQGFSTAQRSETPQYLQAAGMGYDAAVQNYSMEQANDPMGDLFSMGGQAAGMFMMSDRRLKRNVRKIGETPSGVNVYAFDYVWGESAIGVMADEVPHAAVMTPSGYYAVDYARIK